MLPEPYWRSSDGRHVIYHADCREVLAGLEPGSVDAVVTDPPYGVNLGSHSTHRIGNQPYDGYQDTEENVRETVVPVVARCCTLARSVVVTPGTRCVWDYPRPAELGCIFFPAGAGFSRWGFTCSQPILFYGKDPWGAMNRKPNSYRCTENSESNDHPCPKPLRLMQWLVQRASLPDWLVLDPFLGSGTTSVACAQTGRRSIGIEQNERYCEIAVQRMERTLSQPVLFLPERITDAQESLELAS